MTPRGVQDLRRPDAGVTLLELLLATGLAAIVVTAVLTVTQNALRIWTRGEASRDAREVASVVLGGIAEDLRQVHSSSEGDLVVEWVPFDLERDGVVERTFPRIRLVREVSGAARDAIERRAVADAARRARAAAIARGEQDADQPERLTEEELLAAAGVTSTELSAGALGALRDVEGGTLAEVLYAVVPTGGEGAERTTGVLLRAERLHTPGEPLRFMTDEAFDRLGFPAGVDAGPRDRRRRALVRAAARDPDLRHQRRRELVGRVRRQGRGHVLGRVAPGTAGRRRVRLERARARHGPRGGPSAAAAGRAAVRRGRARRRPAPRSVAARRRRPRGDHDRGQLDLAAAGRPRAARPRRPRVDAGASGPRVTSARAHASGTKVLLGEGATLVVPMMLHDDDWGLELDGPGEDAR